MPYSEYVPKHERPLISRLLTLILVNGNTISIHDGEEYAVKRSASINAIRAALASTGEDTVLIRDSSGAMLGHFYLIYNNGSEGDPMIVIADYSANAYCDHIYSQLEAK